MRYCVKCQTVLGPGGSCPRCGWRPRVRVRPAWVRQATLVAGALCVPIAGWVAWNNWQGLDAATEAALPPAKVAAAAPVKREVPALDGCVGVTEGEIALRATFPVKAALAPKPAKFARGLISRAAVGDCAWLMRGYVDTVNEFNAPTRRWWLVRLAYRGDRWLSGEPAIGTDQQTLALLAAALRASTAKAGGG